MIELKMKICFLRQCWTKGWRQIHEIKQNSIFYGIFTADVLQFFYQKTSKFLVGWLGTCHQKQAF